MPIDIAGELTAWERRGRTLNAFGHAVFAVSEGDSAKEPLLVLHGFPTSSADFRHALGALAADRRVVVHDHLGFGLSDKPERYSYSLIEQAEMAIFVWQELGITAGHLLAHDYGTSVATELLARRERGLLPMRLSSVTLCNGSVHLELAKLRVSQRLLRSKVLGPAFARLASARVFKLQMRRVFARPKAMPEAELDMMWSLLTLKDGRHRLPAISAYLDERVRFRDRWIGALERLDLPAHVLWGRKDPVAVPAIAEALAGEMPRATLTWLEDLGHYPMLEDPRLWADAVLRFVGPLG